MHNAWLSGWLCVELAWTRAWVHSITIRVDVVLVIIWFQFLHVCVCVCVPVYVRLCVLIIVILTGANSLYRFLSFVDVLL